MKQVHSQFRENLRIVDEAHKDPASFEEKFGYRPNFMSDYDIISPTVNTGESEEENEESDDEFEELDEESVDDTKGDLSGHLINSVIWKISIPICI